MFTPTRFAAVLAAVAATAALPAAADAQSVPMRGVVSGSPYGASNGQMAIPVLFSKVTASNAHLKSPVGVIIVNRTMKVKLPGGTTTLPVNLRTGDRFKGVGEVGSLQRRVFYPRVVFPSATVYFRSKELSLAELSAAVDSLRKSLTDLQNQLNALRDGSLKGFQDLYKQLSDLQKALAALKIPAGVDLTSIQSQIDGLTKKLNDLIASLPDFSKFALVTQLPDLSQYVTLSDLTAQLSGYATKTYVDGKVALLQSQIDALPTTAAVNTAITNAINGLNIGQYATTTYVDGKVNTLKSKINEIATDFNSLCSQLKGVIGLPALTSAISCPSLTTLP